MIRRDADIDPDSEPEPNSDSAGDKPAVLWPPVPSHAGMGQAAARMERHMDERETGDNLLFIAETVRSACIEAAIQGYQRAAISGLCHEGAWEAAIDAVRNLNLEALVRR